MNELLNPELLDPNYLRGRLQGHRSHESDAGDDAGYLRISKDEYEDGTENEALERQRAAISRAAAAEGRKIVRWYEDRGVSAWNPRKVRPGYRRWLTDACSGDVVARNLWSLHLDRMYRQPRELEEFLEAAKEHGIRGRTVESSAFDPENTDMVLQARILVAFAAKESDDKSRRITRRNAQLRAKGEPHWASRPFGFKRQGMADNEAIEEGRYAKMPWVLNETEAAVIRDGVAKVLAGWSLSAVAIDWQEQGLVQPSGKPWNQDRVRVLLGHPRNAGHLTMCATTGDLPDGRRHHIIGRGNWPVIIDDATFRRVDAILASNRENWSFRRSTYPYLLSGLVYCGRCAEEGRDVKLNGTQRRIPLYSCMKQPANHKHGCGRLTVSARPLEAAAVRGVLDILASPDNRRRLVAYQALNSHAPAAEARIAELELQRGHLRDIIQASGMDADLAARLGTVDASLQEAKAELAQSDHLVIVADLPTTDDLYAVWDDLAVDVQRGVLREVLRRIVVRPSTRPGRVFDLDRVDPPEFQPWIVEALDLRGGGTTAARRSRRSG